MTDFDYIYVWLILAGVVALVLNKRISRIFVLIYGPLVRRLRVERFVSEGFLRLATVLSAIVLIVGGLMLTVGRSLDPLISNRVVPGALACLIGILGMEWHRRLDTAKDDRAGRVNRAAGIIVSFMFLGLGVFVLAGGHT